MPPPAIVTEREDATDDEYLPAGAHQWVVLHVWLADFFGMLLPPNLVELRELFSPTSGPLDLGAATSAS